MEGNKEIPKRERKKDKREREIEREISHIFLYDIRSIHSLLK